MMPIKTTRKIKKVPKALAYKSKEEIVSIEYFEVDNLEYDPQNPRLPHSIIDSQNEEDVINWMLKDASILELMGSIGQKGFFAAEPLLVVGDPENTNKYFVVEGNRRLTAVKLLLHPELAKKRTKAVKEISREAEIKPESIPAIVYKSRTEILDYLGFKHITGVKPWPALAKAKFLQQLQPDYSHLTKNEQYKALAKAIGSRSDYVRDLLSTVDLYDKMSDDDFFGINGLKEDTIDFGVYYNAMKYSNIAKYIGVNDNLKDPNSNVDLKRLKELASWISEENANNVTRLGDSRNLGKLNKVLGDDKAKDLFLSGRSLDDALMFTAEPSELVRNAIHESFSHIQFANNSAYLVVAPNSAEIETLNQILSIAEVLIDTFNNKLSKLNNRKK